MSNTLQPPLPPLPLIDGRLFVDNSMLELLTTCPRALQYNKLNARISSAEKPSLNFGSAIHEALEYRYAAYKNLAPDPYCEEEQFAILQKYFEAHIPPVDDWRNLNWAVELTRKYNERNMLEPFNLLAYDEPVDCPKCQDQKPCPWCNGTGHRDIMVEMSFAFDLFTWHGLVDGKQESIPVMYTGRIDLPVLWDGALFVMDHKTTSLLGTTFFERASMMAQQRGYCWAFQKLTGRTVNGYIINALRTKEPPQYITNPGLATRRQSPEQWWNESFQREKFYVTQEVLEEWKLNTIRLVETFFYHYQQGYMPMHNPNSCVQFGKCQYFDVCSLPASNRYAMLESGLYAPNTWSPLKEPSQSRQ